MAWTRRNIITCVSIAWLLIAIVIAGYSASRANTYSLPISNILSSFTTALPIVSGLLLEGGHHLTRPQERRRHLSQGQTKRPPLVILFNTFIFIYSTAIVTLLGTHTAPSAGLNCGLRERWLSLYRLKDADAIKKIQEAFSCCGLVNPLDMPWPFPGTDGAGACKKATGRNNGCMSAWKAEEQQMAGNLMGVVGMVFVWQIVIIVTRNRREYWFHGIIPDQSSQALANGSGGGSHGPQGAIEYASAGNRYSDHVEEVEEEEQDANINALEEGNRRLNNVLPGPVDQAQETSIENEWAGSR